MRVLGPEKFGLIAFAQAFVQYFVLLTDYGFNLSATREVSISRNDKERVSEIFSSVMVVKIALMIFSFLLMCLFVFTFNKFKDEWLIYLFSFGVVVGNVFFPLWLFQGMERMKQIAALNIIPKSSFTVSIFIFIKTQHDYLYVPLINSLGFIATGLISYRTIFREFCVRFKVPAFAEIKHQLSEGLHIFVSTIAINLYTVSNTFILGLFTNNVIVGYYNAGERIVKAVLGLLGPLSQTVYPHISKMASESREAALFFIRKIVILVSAPAFMISVFMLIFASQIDHIILGNQFQKSITVIQILSFLPFIVGLSNIFGIQTMLNFGLKQIFTKILIMAGILNIFLATALVTSLQHIGIALSVLTTETFVTTYMFFILQRKGLKVLPLKLQWGVLR